MEVARNIVESVLDLARVTRDMRAADAERAFAAFRYSGFPSQNNFLLMEAARDGFLRCEQRCIALRHVVGENFRSLPADADVIKDEEKDLICAIEGTHKELREATRRDNAGSLDEHIREDLNDEYSTLMEIYEDVMGHEYHQ